MTATVSAKELFRSRSVTPFLLASVASTMAAMIQITALGKQIYDMTGRDLDLALLRLAEFAPAFLLISVTSSIANRYGRGHIASIGLIVEVITTGMLAWYVSTNPTDTTPIFAIVIAFGIGRAFVSPATRSMPADIAPDGGLPRLIAFHVGGWQASAIIGPVAAGFLFVGSPSWPFIACMILAATGAVLIQFAKPRHDRVAPGVSLAGGQDASLIELGDEHHAIGHGTYDERVGHGRYRRAVQNHPIVAPRSLFEETHHTIRSDQLGRVGRYRSAANDVEVGNLGGVDKFTEVVGASRKVSGKTHGALQLESLVNRRTAEICVDQERLETRLRGDDREVGSHQRFALGRDRTGEGHHPEFIGILGQRNGRT